MPNCRIKIIVNISAYTEFCFVCDWLFDNPTCTYFQYVEKYWFEIISQRKLVLPRYGIVYCTVGLKYLSKDRAGGATTAALAIAVAIFSDQ